ncbi:hypothetical protein ALC62_08380, partial [Cyphomyrmex costatus]
PGRRGASERGSEATIFDPRRDKGSVGAVAGPTARIMCGASWCLARWAPTGPPPPPREWRILCRFLVDRAPDSIAIGSLCPVPG